MAARDERRSAAVAVSSDRSLDWKAEIGSISSDIKVLQEKSMDMGLKLKNRKVNDEYMRTLENLSKKLKFVEADLMVKTSKALRDVQPELERLRQKAVSKVFEFIVQKLYALRKPKTNIQILQQSVLLKYMYVISFLKEHGKEVYVEVRAAYIDTMNKLIMSRRRVPCLDSYLDKVNIALWPRFKMVFDMHLSSLRNANVKTLGEDDVHPHYVMGRYAEFTASLIHLIVEYGDGQLELNLERLRMAADDLLVKLAKMFPKPKLQIVFLINNYDMTIIVLKEACPEGGKIQPHFEELLKNHTAVFVEELLVEHFSDLIKFVKTRAFEDPTSDSERPINSTVSEVEPLVKDFASRWKGAIELMHNDVIMSFSNFLCGMEILRAALTQLLLYYTRLSDCIKRIVGGSTLNKDLVSISSIMYEIRKYSRTF